MKIRTRYLLFVILLHLITLVLSYFIFLQDKLFFLLAEVFILVSLVLSWQLYKALIAPLRLLMQGAEAIKDKDFTVRLLPTGSHEMDELIGIYNRMIDELRNERTRQEQQHLFLGKLIQGSPTGILVLDFDDRVQQANPRALRLLGLKEEQVTGLPVTTLVHPAGALIGKLRSGEAQSFAFNGIVTLKIQKSHFIDRGFARHFVMIEELTTEIHEAEKMAYERVIRMMAHEVNNTIGPVNSILQSALGREKLWKDGEHRVLQDALRVAVDRNHNLNIFMRNFADVVRLPQPNKKKLDLNALVLSIGRLLQPNSNEIGFEYRLTPDPVYIEADEQQMEQVLINVVRNAMESIEGRAMIEGPERIEEKGTIVFCVEERAQLTITDNGSGIAEEHAVHLFSPFFSTKKDGQGIGLTLVKEILVKHGFSFSLRSAGKGQTVFAIGFPPGGLTGF